MAGVVRNWCKIGRWMCGTPVQTFMLCPLVVVAAETALRAGHLVVVPWGALLIVWGYLQYQFVGRYRGSRAGGGPGMQTLPGESSILVLTVTRVIRCISDI